MRKFNKMIKFNFMKKYLLFTIFCGVLVLSGCRKKEEKKIEEVRKEEIKQDKNNDVVGKDKCSFDNKTYFQIPELNIEFLVNKDFGNEIIYKIENYKGGKNILFTTKNLIKYEGCQVEEAPVGVLHFVEGNLENNPDKEYLANRVLKKIDNGFWWFETPQAVCNPDILTEETAEKEQGKNIEKNESKNEENSLAHKYQGFILFQSICDECECVRKIK